MKRTFTLFAAILLLAVGATAQKLSYQAVVRNTANELVYDAQVTVSLKILAADGATVQYAETQTATTNQNGLLTLIIGDNSSATGDLTTVVWADASIRTDITLPTGDVVTNIMPVTAVPYALYANDAGGNLDQIQSDWLETNMVSKAYIKNKPTLAPVATSGNYSDLSGTPNLAPVATSGSYGDLTGTPTLAPVATSGNYGDLNGTPNLAPVATSGNYSDLSGTPNLAPVATSGNYSDLSGTPTLAPVATSGSYGDLTGTPTLAPVATSGNYSDLNGTPNLASVATSGNYSDLNGTPTIPDAQVNADWNATSGITQILNKPTLASVATSGNYSDLSGTPNLAPVATSGSYGDLTGTPTLAPVATSGSYSDLTGTPTIPAAQVNADWNATSGITQILNKPTLASVATSGNYSDLSGAPDVYTKTETNNLLAGKANLSDIHNSTITIQKNGETVGSFTLNQSADQTINISVPTSEGSGTTIIQTISLSGNVLTLSDGGGQVTLPSETDPTVPSWAKSETKPVYDYSEITNTPTLPTIPANVSAFNNDNGYLTRDSIEVLQATVNNLVALVNSLNMRMYQEQFTAAAGQTIFTLEHAAKTNCIVRMYINGVMVGGNHNGVLEINENDATKVVYDASLNRNYNLKANDKVTIVYWY